MRRLIRLLVFGVVAFVVIMGGALLSQSGREARQEAQAQSVIDSTTPRRGDLRVAINATGSVTPDEQLPLFFEGNGLVAEIFVHEGDTVAAGDPIARLDTSDLDATIAEAEIALELQRIAYDALTSPVREADLAVAEAVVAAAQASLNAAYVPGNPNAAEIAALQSEIARNRLWQAQLQRDAAANSSGFTPDISGFIPDDVEVPQEIIDQINQGISGLLPSVPGVDPDQFTAGLNQAEFGVEIADANAAAADSGANQGSIAQANAALVSSQAALDRLLNGASDNDLQSAEIALLQAQNALEQARSAQARSLLVAPFNGVIAQIQLNIGELPPSQTSAALLVDTGALYVDLSVDETDVVELEVGQPVELNFDALPESEITGEVAEIALAPLALLDPTIASGLVTYPVRVRLEGAGEGVRIGMSATATITVRSLTDVLIVPNRFIRIERTSGDAFVTVERSTGRFEEVRVVLGVRNEIESEIVSGITEDDRLVLVPRGTFDPFS